MRNSQISILKVRVLEGGREAEDAISCGAPFCLEDYLFIVYICMYIYIYREREIYRDILGLLHYLYIYIYILCV